MPLTDSAIRSFKPIDKAVKLSDGDGLFLIVTPTRGKWWRLKYRFEGKEKLLSFGTYPITSLKDVRDRRDEARKLLANGADPGAVKKAQKAERTERAANTFEAVAGKWFEKWETEVTYSTAKSQRERLEKHIMPFLGACPIADTTASKVLAALRPLEDRGTRETLRKAKMAISQIMDFAVQNEWTKHNPVPSLNGAFKAASQAHGDDPESCGVWSAAAGLTTIKPRLARRGENLGVSLPLIGVAPDSSNREERAMLSQIRAFFEAHGASRFEDILSLARAKRLAVAIPSPRAPAGLA
jgi:hypothetical protein